MNTEPSTNDRERQKQREEWRARCLRMTPEEKRAAMLRIMAFVYAPEAPECPAMPSEGESNTNTAQE